jgi:hypothetical protein
MASVTGLEHAAALLVIGGGCITVVAHTFGRAETARARRRDREIRRRAPIAERAWQDQALANSRERQMATRNRRLDSMSLRALDAQLADIPVDQIVDAYSKEN